MTSSNFWWQSGAGGGGGQIGNSLRFRGAQRLMRIATSNGGNVFTYSTWLKTSTKDTGFIVFHGTQSDANYGTSGAYDGGGWYSDGPSFAAGPNSSSKWDYYLGAINNTQKYRDPSAWYHVVWNCDGTTARIFVNGELRGQDNITQNFTYWNQSGFPQHLGAYRAPNGALSSFFDGYMAETHFVSSTALDPTVFGEFNAQGVWVPKAVDTTTLNYGANGFYLDFADPDNIGRDARSDSPGFGNWYGSVSGANTSGSWGGVLDGSADVNDVSSFIYCVSQTSTLTFATPITGEIEVFGSEGSNTTGGGGNAARLSDNSTLSFDGVPRNNPQWKSFGVKSGITSIACVGGSVHGFILGGIRVNGEILWQSNDFTPTGFELTDTTSSNFDWMEDHPAKNYATLNPLTGVRPGGATGRTYSDGNLVEYTPASPGKEHPLITATQWLRSADGGVYQWEDTVTNSNAYITFAPWMETENAYGSGNAAFFSFYNYDGSGGTVSVGTGYGATGTVQEQGVVLSANDVVTTVVDFDNNTIAFYVNGTRNGYITGCNFSNWDIWSPGFAIATSGATATTHKINFGQRPFLYPPGFSSPTTAFNTVLYTGNSSSLVVNGVGFESDLIWIKNRSGAYHHYLVDSVRGWGTSAANSGGLASNLTNAEPYPVTGFVESVNSDGFVLGNSSSTYVNTNVSGDNYVAWCWNAGDGSPVTNTDGTITSTVKADPSAGFSVVTYTGNLTAGATVGHGLTSAPGMVIIKFRNGDRNWVVYHKSVGGTGCLQLNTTDSVNTDYSFFNNTDTTDTVFTLGNDARVNAAGDAYVAYCFADTPDRVKTGSYVGNGSTDGPYVECGFKPAMVLRKASTDTSNWNMQDTARGNTSAYANLSDSEGTGSEVTMLNDGFKVSSSAMNGSGTTYIYIAFAENFTPDDVKDLTAKNLEAVDIPDPSDHFQTVLDTGANILTTAQATFPNGLWWIKDRQNTNNHQLVDSVRGGNLAVYSNLTSAESSYLAPSGSSVAWCWNLLPNRSNGFDILEYAGNAAATRAIPHNLSQAPEFIIVKSRDLASSWSVWHKDLGASGRLFLNDTQASGTNTTYFGGAAATAPDSTNFYVGSNADVNGSPYNYVAYLWHSVPGFSSIGLYTGNGNVDGPFVFTGHRPAWIMIKNVDAPGGWYISDGKRSPYNVVNGRLMPHLSNGESTSVDICDFTANGFKIRTSDSGWNASGNNYTYISFAEHPFGGSNVSPSPAR